MIRKYIVFWVMFVSALFTYSCDHSQNKKSNIKNLKPDSSNPVFSQPNVLSEQEKIEGWSLLFDGLTDKGWKGYNLDSFPKSGWRIEEGTIHCIRSEKRAQLQDIISTEQYKNFELSIEWMISDSASSGIFLFAQERANIPLWKTGLKMQIIDNAGNPDSRFGKNGNHLNGSLYDILPINTRSKSPLNIWNQTRIIVYEGKVEFIQNGEKILEFHPWTDDWKKTINKTKYKGIQDFLDPGGNEHTGHIGLQNNGYEVWFRNIKIRIVN